MARSGLGSVRPAPRDPQEGIPPSSGSKPTGALRRLVRTVRDRIAGRYRKYREDRGLRPERKAECLCGRIGRSRRPCSARNGGDYTRSAVDFNIDREPANVCRYNIGRGLGRRLRRRSLASVQVIRRSPVLSRCDRERLQWEETLDRLLMAGQRSPRTSAFREHDGQQRVVRRRALGFARTQP
jgi:hypothetical protein